MKSVAVTPNAAVSPEPSAEPTKAPPFRMDMSVANSVASTPCACSAAYSDAMVAVSKLWHQVHIWSTKVHPVEITCCNLLSDAQVGKLRSCKKVHSVTNVIVAMCRSITLFADNLAGKQLCQDGQFWRMCGHMQWAGWQCYGKGSEHHTARR